MPSYETMNYYQRLQVVVILISGSIPMIVKGSLILLKIQQMITKVR